MLIAMLVATIGLAQPAPDAPPPPSDTYLVEDPFNLDVAEDDENGVAMEPTAVPVSQAQAEQSRERLICKSRPQLNSRTRWLRVCMTAAEWEHHATNMEQQRRDINDWGAQGGAGPE